MGSLSVGTPSVSRSGGVVTVSIPITGTSAGETYLRIKVNGSTWKTSAKNGSISGTYTDTISSWAGGSKTYTVLLQHQWQQGGSFSDDTSESKSASWSAASFTVTFNANGGTVSPGSKTVTYGSAYGDLPTPTRANYIFLGWFTDPSGGSQVTSGTAVSITANQTLYAHWQEDFFHGAHIVRDGQAKQVKSVFRVSSGISAQVRKAYLVTAGQVNEL